MPLLVKGESLEEKISNLDTRSMVLPGGLQKEMRSRLADRLKQGKDLTPRYSG